jgi:hypothetical protein
MATEPTQMPDGGGAMQGAPGGPSYSGTATSVDPTMEPGNYGPSLFGVQLPQGTGASGTAGAYGMAVDPTNEPGQTSDGFTGLTAPIVQTGAPGSAGSPVAGGGDRVTYTEPGSYLSGTNKQATAAYPVSGPDDGTQGVNGYSTGGNLPGVQGNTPTSTGAGAGSVQVGGRAVRP